MSQITRDINKITGTIIGISGKLILYALIVMLLIEGMTKGYAFGHEVFYSTPMEPEPGSERSVTIPEGESELDVARILKDSGLIRNEYAARIQMWFYDYTLYPGTYDLNTSMTSKEILQVLSVRPETAEDMADMSEAVETAEAPEDSVEVVAPEDSVEVVAPEDSVDVAPMEENEEVDSPESEADVGLPAGEADGSPDVVIE